MTRDFSNLERLVIQYLKSGEKIKDLNTHQTFSVVCAGKPGIPDGEPKTDVYAKLDADFGAGKELKISIKQPNADFLENKTNAKRAEEIFGKNWKKIVEGCTKSISDRFKKKSLIFFDKDGHTDAGSFTLGWKFEILNKESGDLSGKILLSNKQKMDILAGTSLPLEKRNATVNGIKIKDSGVANCMLITDEQSIHCSQEVYNDLIDIKKYSQKNDFFFACKALNYRSKYQKNGKEGKYDGNRPLAVLVKWSYKNGKLVSELVFDDPLENGGDDSYKLLNNALHSMRVETTDDLREDEIDAHYYKEY
jgi:hypothetical protein